MAKIVDFIFDFASPNAYLAYKTLPPILALTGAKMNIVPCLLGGIFRATGNKPPMIAFGEVKGKLEYDRLEMVPIHQEAQSDEFQIQSPLSRQHLAPNARSHRCGDGWPIDALC